jgi:hypothetical protein
MIKKLLQYKQSNKVTYSSSSGSQGAVAQLDDTSRGMFGNICHPEGCLWKNNNYSRAEIQKYFCSFLEMKTAKCPFEIN